jgi:hemoglobin
LRALPALLCQSHAGAVSSASSSILRRKLTSVHPHTYPAMMKPLYEQAGGEDGIRAVLDDLYTRLFADPMVGFLFAGRDKDHIVREQTAFTRRMLGDASAVYTGKSIPDAHASLPILAGHFDRRHRVLAEVLQSRGLPEEARDAWLRLDQGLRTAVMRVGRARADALNRDEGER